MVGSKSEDSEAGVAACEVINIQVNFKCFHCLFKTSIFILQLYIGFAGIGLDASFNSSHYYLLLDIKRDVLSSAY